ncbi:MAG TPA: DUF1549 domain-containing protein [Candidatus Nanopelagicales bacterium]|nr:DUF1549 domain-containing protein [Candidatus Nanopelagicales bacterium]
MISTAAIAAACAGTLPDDEPDRAAPVFNPNEPEDPDDAPIPEEAYDVLNERVLDPSEALRTTSLKLLGRLPTLAEIKAVESGGQAAYEARLDAMLTTPDFAKRMIRWWQDIMRQGGGPGDDRNTAPTLAAKLIVEGRPFLEILTATDNCATYDAASNTFAAAPCQSGAPAEAGVLTSPGVMRQFRGNMAFRRVRWIQEIFACQEMPAEQGDTQEDIDGGVFRGPWPFASISGSPVDFLSTEGTTCANCHQTLNHVAPLVGHFDADGRFQEAFAVLTNVGGEEVPAERDHWLPEGEPTAWRFGKPATTLEELGQVMAADPAVQSCVVARAWNFVMSKEDIVSAGAVVPEEVIQPYVDRFRADLDLKETLRAMFKGDDFIKR